MGKFVYENTVKIEFEDRLLAHLQFVVAAKLRRGESFMFSWKEDISTGGGRSSVWIHPSAGMHFKFHGGRMPTMNRDWLTALSYTANSPRGLYVVPEPEPGSLVDIGKDREPMVFPQTELSELVHA